MEEGKTSVLKIDESFKFVGSDKGRYETEHFWAELRIKGEEGDFYIDILIGRKGEKIAKCHMGFNHDQSLRFVNPREVLKTMNRRVESKLYGLLEDKTILIKPEPGVKNFTFRIVIDGPSKTIEVLFSESGFGPEHLPYQNSTTSENTTWTSSSRWHKT